MKPTIVLESSLCRLSATSKRSLNSIHRQIPALLAGCILLVAAPTKAGASTNVVTIPAEFATPAGAVDKTKAGFRIRPYQTEENNPNSLAWTEDQLAGLHGPNLADLTGADATGFLNRDTVINFDIGAGAGNFMPDDPIPGFPGTATRDGGTGNSTMEILTFLEFLKAGSYTMGVNSDDGFRVTTARNPQDRTGLVLGFFDGGRGAADTTFNFNVAQPGIYPFRMIWENGGGGANVEWFMVEGTNKVLINDSATAGSLKAYREGRTPPYVKSVSPAPGARLVPLNSSINVTLTDSTTAVQASSVQLFLDGTKVNATVNKASGSKDTTVTFKPAADLSRALHAVRLIYNDSATPALVVTNDYTFSTEEQYLFDFADATVWRYNREGLDLGTAWRAPNFNDSAWEKGPGPIGDNADASEPVPIKTPITRFNDAGDHITTLYVRGHFNWPGKDIAGVKLALTHMVDDGAVFYLNGVELHRFGIGATATFGFDTFFSGHEAAFSGPYDVSVAGLVPGDNVFAAEVHQSDAGSSDIVFGAQLVFKVVADITPPTLLSALEGSTLDKVLLSFSEGIDLASAQTAANYSLAPITGGANLAVTSAVVSSGTNVTLTTAPRTQGTQYALSIAEVKDTSGNKIVATRVGVGTLKPLVAIDDKTMWRYENTGQDLGTTWRDKTFNDSSWPQGAALLALESGATADTKRTDLVRQSPDGVGIITDYFRTHFNFTGDPATTRLQLRHIVDDGVVFYLNGVELHRFGVAAGQTSATTATDHENRSEGPFDVPSSALVVGDNVLAAEVHQGSATSSDIVFGAELSTIFVPPLGNQPPPTSGLKFTTFTRSGSNLSLEWTGAGTLQSADAVTGPWTDVANAKSPFTATISGKGKFYRLRQ